MKLVVVLLLVAAAVNPRGLTSAWAQPSQQTPEQVMEFQSARRDQGEVSCTTVSATLLTSSWGRRSVMFRNLGTGDVYICASVGATTEGGAPGTCTTAAAGIFLGGTAKDAVTLDVSTFGVSWACITSTGTATVKYYAENGP